MEQSWLCWAATLGILAALSSLALPLALPLLCPTDPARQLYEERDPYFGVSLACTTTSNPQF